MTPGGWDSYMVALARLPGARLLQLSGNFGESIDPFLDRLQPMGQSNPHRRTTVIEPHLLLMSSCQPPVLWRLLLFIWESASFQMEAAVVQMGLTDPSNPCRVIVEFRALSVSLFFECIPLVTFLRGVRSPRLDIWSSLCLYRHLIIALFLLTFDHRAVSLDIWSSLCLYRHLILIITLSLSTFGHRAASLDIWSSLCLYRHLILIIALSLSTFGHRSASLDIWSSLCPYRHLILIMALSLSTFGHRVASLDIWSSLCLYRHLILIITLSLSTFLCQSSRALTFRWATFASGGF
jgi:hypothetical protein